MKHNQIKFMNIPVQIRELMTVLKKKQSALGICFSIAENGNIICHIETKMFCDTWFSSNFRVWMSASVCVCVCTLGFWDGGKLFCDKKQNIATNAIIL